MNAQIMHWSMSFETTDVLAFVQCQLCSCYNKKCFYLKIKRLRESGSRLLQEQQELIRAQINRDQKEKKEQHITPKLKVCVLNEFAGRFTIYLHYSIAYVFCA